MQQPKKTMKKMVEPLKTGELLVKEGFVRLDDIDMALSIQEKRQSSVGIEKNRLMGMILCDLNLITPADNFYVLHKYNKLKSIQSALISDQMLSQDAVLKTREMSKQRNLPFISLLLKTGQVSTSHMQKLLFDLFHVPFRSVRDFSFDQNDKHRLIRVMDVEQSMKNKVVPLVLKGNTMLFGITDPDNMLLIRQLSEQFPQYRFKVVFIPYSGFSQFSKIIYSTNIDSTQIQYREEPLDLSLLLKYKTSIAAPDLEKGSIQTLYHRYEQLLHLSCGQRKENRQDEFSSFVSQMHKKITREYQSRSIEFSLKKEDNSVCLVALPKR